MYAKCTEILKLNAHFGLALPKRTSFCRFLFIMVRKYSIGKGGVGSSILLGGTKRLINYSIIRVVKFKIK